MLVRKPDSVETLRRLPLFEGLEASTLAVIARAIEERTFAPGDVLVREGAPGPDVFFIVEGHCEVRREQGGPAGVLATLGPGEVFGEMAMLSPGPWTASVIALEDVLAYTVSHWQLKPILEAHPGVAIHMLGSLAARFKKLQSDMARLHAAQSRSG